MLFYELDGHIAVRFDLGIRQGTPPPQGRIVVEHAVVGQRKPGAGHLSGERVVVPVELCPALGGHAAVPHDGKGILRDKEVQLVGRAGTLIDVERTGRVIGNPGCIGPPGLTL